MIRPPTTSPRLREALPTREEIDAMVVEAEIVDLEARLEASRQQVEVDLEFATDKELEWERRARGYLTAVRITLANVRKQLHRLRTAGKHIPNSEAQQRAASAKAERKLAHELSLSNALTQKARQQQAVEIQQAMLNRKLIEKLSYHHHFHAVAHEILGEEVCRQLSNAAAERVRAAAAAILGVQP